VRLAARPRAGGQVITAGTRRQRIRAVRAFSGPIIERDWPGAPSRHPVIAGDIPESPGRCPSSPGDRDAARLMAAARASAGPRGRLVAGLPARTGMRAGEPAAWTPAQSCSPAPATGCASRWASSATTGTCPRTPSWSSCPLPGPRPASSTSAAASGRRARRAPAPAPPHAGHPGPQPRHAAGGHRRAARPPENGDDPDLRPDRQPGRGRRIRPGQRQDRRPLRPAARAACRLRGHRHGPAAPRSTRPDARHRSAHPPRRAGLPPGIRPRDLRLLPHRHRVPAHPHPAARPRPRPRPGRPGRHVRRAHPPRRTGLATTGRS
jgi:hypothetical protein